LRQRAKGPSSRHSPTIFLTGARPLVTVIYLVARALWHQAQVACKQRAKRVEGMEDTKPSTCERCGVYALLSQDYPYCAACLIILAEGKHYLFTVDG
jgi:hypothetical protein